MKLILATSTFCGPCHMLKRKLAEQKIEVETIDLEQDTDKFREYDIRAVPRLVVVRDGVVTERIQGAEEILKTIKNYAKDQKES